MAERIVSPGVFTEERDLSFLPQGISDIGAAIIGPTEKGPAFTPTILSNFKEFENTFGKVLKIIMFHIQFKNILKVPVL